MIGLYLTIVPRPGGRPVDCRKKWLVIKDSYALDLKHPQSNHGSASDTLVLLKNQRIGSANRARS